MAQGQQEDTDTTETHAEENEGSSGTPRSVRVVGNVPQQRRKQELRWTTGQYYEGEGGAFAVAWAGGGGRGGAVVKVVGVVGVVSRVAHNAEHLFRQSDDVEASPQRRPSDHVGIEQGQLFGGEFRFVEAGGLCQSQIKWVKSVVLKGKKLNVGLSRVRQDDVVVVQRLFLWEDVW